MSAPDDRRAKLLASMLPKSPEGEPCVGKYVLAELLGAGGMGMVFKAREIGGDDTIFAVKVLPLDVGSGGKDFAQRFHREARLARKIEQENVVRVFDDGQEGMVLFLVMEFCDGGSVRDILSRDGPMSVRQALEIIRQTAQGLQAAHEEGVIHRDIKPDNIFYSKSCDKYKVGDLGLAKNIGADKTASLTKTHMAFGTPPYMSPEQIANAKSVDKRTDIYALGASLFEMLTGITPYTGDSALHIMRDVLQKPTPDPRHFKPDLDQKTVRFVKRLMSKDPNDRPQDCGQLLEMLLPLLVRETRTRTFDFSPRKPAAPPEFSTAAETMLESHDSPAEIPKTIVNEEYTVAQFSPIGAPLTMNQPLPSPILPKMRTVDELTDSGEPPEIIVNSLGMPFLRIEVYDDGGPDCAGEFYISKYPVTWGEFEVYKEDHSFKRAKYHNDRHPVTFLDWELAAGFCRYLTERDGAAGILPQGLVYRLPFENEWMRAAGWCLHKKKMHIWPWGDEWNKEYCNSAESRMDRTRVVGRYIRGISSEWCHGMAGNVYEWCNPNPGEEREDDYKVLKGGGFQSNREECMVASRQWADPTLQEPDIGFRVVRAEYKGD